MSPPRDIVKFMLRWRSKAENYDFSTLYACFDGFFTTFVLYNFLYDYICQVDKDKYPETSDSQRSIEVARRFLGPNIISIDPVIRQSAKELRSLGMEKPFLIRDANWDSARVSGLDSTDNVQWSKCLLEVIYQIRCNTFHGRKPFQEAQKKVLLPCIAILRRVNDLLIEQLAPGALKQKQGKRSGGTSDVGGREFNEDA